MKLNDKGAALIVVIIAMTMMAVLGSAIYRLTTTASYSELLANNNDQAYQLALAGVRYCAANRSCTLPSTTFTLYMPDANHIVTIAMSGSNVLTSTGIVNPGTFLEARRVIVSDMVPIWGTTTSSTGVISSEGDMPSFGDPNTSGSGSAITSDQTTQTISLGGNVTDGSGSLWYTGSSSAANCTAGSCYFNIGIRTYFNFSFTNEDFSTGSTTYGDGFAFAIISALTNTSGRTGGAPPGVSIGELLGYAGPGNTTDKLGLKPPKMAIEFDTYPNSNGDVCSSGSRNDNPSGSTFRNHAAIMFWGDDATTDTCTSYPKKTFDDNRHGAVGTDTEHGPVNSSNPDPTGLTDTPSSGYYQNSGLKYTCKSSSNSCNWMEDGYTYSFRLEIDRPTTATGGVYNYVFRVWIYRLDAIAGFINHFQDVTSPFTDTAPHIIRTVSFTATQHANLNQIFFGFTEATGASTQQITVGNMKFFFPTCSYAISPTTISYSNTGGTGSISLTATNSSATTCPWTATSYANWITINSGSSGTGNGTVNFTVSANTGCAARTGFINIAGQAFTVTQAAAAFTISPTSRTVPRAVGTGSISVSAGSNCTWTATRSGNWITITSGSSGTGPGIVNYSYTRYNGAIGTSRTGTITVTNSSGTAQVFTLTQTRP